MADRNGGDGTNSFYGDFFYGHRDDYTNYTSDATDDVNVVYNNIEVNDSILKITIKVILTIALIYLTVKVFR